MFKINELVIYGSNGVCRIEGIGQPDFTGVEKGTSYYMLRPVHAKGSVIYSPIDNPRIAMRRIVTFEEAQELIDNIPYIDAIEESDRKILEAIYKKAINTCDCREWVKVIKTVYQKQENELNRGKPIGQVDKRYRKQAEDLLYGELCIPLNIPKESVEQYIAENVG